MGYLTNNCGILPLLSLCDVYLHDQSTPRMVRDPIDSRLDGLQQARQTDTKKDMFRDDYQSPKTSSCKNRATLKSCALLRLVGDQNALH